MLGAVKWPNVHLSLPQSNVRIHIPEWMVASVCQRFIPTKKNLTSALQHHKRDMDPTKKLDLRTMNGLPSILMGLATSRKPWKSFRRKCSTPGEERNSFVGTACLHDLTVVDYSIVTDVLYSRGTSTFYTSSVHKAKSLSLVHWHLHLWFNLMET